MKQQTITRYLTNDTAVDNWFITAAKTLCIVVGFGLAAIVPIAGVFREMGAMERHYEPWNRRKEEEEDDSPEELLRLDSLTRQRTVINLITI